VLPSCNTYCFNSACFG